MSLIKILKLLEYFNAIKKKIMVIKILIIYINLDQNLLIY